MESSVADEKAEVFSYITHLRRPRAAQQMREDLRLCSILGEPLGRGVEGLPAQVLISLALFYHCFGAFIVLCWGQDVGS